MYQVLLIDDERLVLASLRHRIQWEKCGFTICGETGNAKDGLEKIRDLHPDLVFTDIRMPGMSGLDLIQQAQRDFPQTRFVVISGYSEFEYAKRAIEYGVLGFCVKPFDEDEIEGLLERIRIQLDYQAEVSPAHEKEKKPAAVPIRPGDNPERIDGELRKLGIPESQPKWIVQILQGESLSVLENCLLESRIWSLSGMGTNWFLLSGSNAPEEVTKVLKNASAQCAAGISREFLSGEGLERAAAEARCAAFGYFFGNPGVHVFKGPLESPELPEILRALRSAFQARDLAGLRLTVEKFQEGRFSIRDAFRFYNTAALLPPQEKMPLCDSYTELAARFPNIGALLSEVTRCLCESAASLGESDSRSSTMRRILLYINEHYGDPELSVGKVSEMFGFNPNYISQLFKKSEHEGFTAYLTRVRMEHAMRLLRESDCQIREVGEQCGYSDYFYFARVFKKYTGRSPGNTVLTRSLRRPLRACKIRRIRQVGTKKREGLLPEIC